MKRMTRSCTIKFYFKKTSRFLRFLRKFVRFPLQVKNISVKIQNVYRNDRGNRSFSFQISRNFFDYFREKTAERVERTSFDCHLKGCYMWKLGNFHCKWISTNRVAGANLQPGKGWNSRRCYHKHGGKKCRKMQQPRKGVVSRTRFFCHFFPLTSKYYSFVPFFFF